MIINSGGQDRVISRSTTVASTTSAEGSVRTQALAATLWVSSITGTLDVSVYTLTDSGRETLLFSFPQQSAASTALLLLPSNVTMQRFRVVGISSGACTYEVYVRAIDGPVSVQSGGGGDTTLEDPNVHIIRELLQIDSIGMLIVSSPAILMITDGSAGRYARIYTSSTVEYA